MATLTLIKDGKTKKIPFTGQPILNNLLVEAGEIVFSPCGGKGICGKCKVILSGAVSEPNRHEIEANCRLSCQAVLLGDCTAEFSENLSHIQIETETKSTSLPKSTYWNYGVAIDVGTTTVVLKLYNSKGDCIGEGACINPQTSVSADVIGRIDASLKGKADLLQKQILDCIDDLLSMALKNTQIQKESIDLKIITGNTAMLYLLANISPKSIAFAPFKSETLFGEWIDEKTYLPPCIDAFVGADITCSLLSSGICDSDQTAILCDMGTNGEIALWKNKRLYVTSTAMGPCFEGASISCGCSSVNGAIDRVYIENRKIKATTIGGYPAMGICGSGLIDAAKVFLELGYIEKDGSVNRPLILSANGGQIEISPEDVASVQLAKSAVYSGIQVLLKETQTNQNEIEAFYLAGGFGSHISVENAVKIGLIPDGFTSKTQILGNASLSGAIDLLFDKRLIPKAEEIAKNSQHIQLGGNPDFNSAFIENMLF